MRNTSITTRALMFIGGLLGIAALLSYLVFSKYQVDFEHHHRTLSEQAVRSVISELKLMLNEIERATKLFISSNEDLIWQMSRNPDDELLFSQINRSLHEHFPEHYSFTITDRDGNLLYDDLGEAVGDLCRRNIQQEIRSDHATTIVVHPGPGDYHIDIMVPWSYQGVEQGIFFKSYKLDAIARLLQFAQPKQHKLVLTRSDDPLLIEIASEGGRDVVQRTRSNRLTALEVQRIAYQQEVDGTEWILNDIYDENLLSDYRLRLWRPLLGAWVTVLILSLASLYIINREEQRRNKAEARLRRSHEMLEEAVQYRTQDLMETNEQLTQEIKRRDMAESMQKIFMRAASQSSEIVLITDKDGKVEYVNPCFEKSTGYSMDEAVGRKGDLLKSGLMEVSFYNDLWETITSKKDFSAVFVNRKKNGDLIYMDQTITPLVDESGCIEHYIATARDITEDKSNQERLRFISEHDLLTNIHNRSYLESHLNGIISTDPLKRRHFALIFLDIDRFDKVTEGIGHQASDQILVEVAKQVRDMCRDYDLAARFGGDQFVIMLDSVTNAEGVLPEIERLQQKLIKTSTADGDIVPLTASFGIALYPEDGENYELLIKNAFAAHKRAKGNGGNSAEFYRKGMTEAATDRMRLEKHLNKAVENQDLTFSYQPKVVTATGELSGFELLSRWVNSETGQATSPAIFIPILEENGLISALWDHSMVDACSMLTGFLLEIRPEISIAMNLSAKQLIDHNLVDHIRSYVEQYELPPSALEFEITESMLIENLDRAIMTLEGIKSLGCKLAIDDFGTGYSSMRYLKSLPLDVIKIDKSFTSEIDTDNNDRVFVKTIIDMAHSLGMSTVAEGVETRAQFDVLLSLGCDLVQGYLVSKPMPGDEVVPWIESAQA